MTISNDVRVGIVNLGINNLSSIANAFHEIKNTEVLIFNSASDFSDVDLLVLPGVGAFGEGMQRLANTGFDEKIKSEVSKGTHLLGVCLGMQLLGIRSAESPDVTGLNLIQFDVEKLPSNLGEKVPHVGWNEVKSDKNEEFIVENRDFYFVHSFAVLDAGDALLASTSFGSIEFASGVKKDNILGFQFHPEKSSTAGINLLSKVVRWAYG